MEAGLPHSSLSGDVSWESESFCPTDGARKGIDLSHPEPKRKRSAQEIRNSLEETREQIEGDLDDLGGRVQQTLDLRHQIIRHPLVLGLAGAAVGFLVVKRPALVIKALSRIAKWGTPMLLTAFLRPPSNPEQDEAMIPEAPPPSDHE